MTVKGVNVMYPLAAQLRAARIAAGLTQRQLGEMCGYAGNSAERTVQHWESGRSMPPLDKLRALADALNVSLDYLIP